MSTISSNLPDYRFVVASAGPFSGVAAREVEAEQNSVNILNTKGASDFQDQCNAWIQTATAARNNKQPLPAKPISPPRWIVVSEDDTLNGSFGKYIARAQIGPVYGVCPDLPPAATDAPSTGKIFTGPQQALTQDQKLDAIMAGIKDISDRMKKGGI